MDEWGIRGRRALWLAVLLALLACSAPSPRQTGADQVASPASPASTPRTLVAAIQREPTSLALRAFSETFAAPYLPTRMFNAGFAVLDDQGMPQPYLVEALPQLNSDTWIVFPDGTMETTYRFRPNLTWQDGTPFSTQDYLFSWKVFSTPELGLSRSGPFDAMTDVVAVDDRTLVIRWNRPYPDAMHLNGRDRQFPALPRHRLQAAFESQPVDGFPNLPYWTREYVGLGPYKLASWEPGSFLEATAFDGHANGRAGIDRIKLVFIGDPNSAIANALSGEVQVLADNAIAFGHGLTLRQQWEASQAGSVQWNFTTWRGIDVQARPAFVQPPSLQDVRVRKALAVSVDRQTVNDTIYGGVGLLADYVMAPIGQWADAVRQGVVSYQYEPRQAEQLMRAAGYEKGSDGRYTHPLQGPFTADLKTSAGADNEKEVAAIADGWRNLGFDIAESIVPVALAQDVQVRASYPGLYLLSTPGGDRTAAVFTPNQIPLPENNWRGGNRSGWTHPEYTGLANAFISTLDVGQRKQQVAQMARIYSENVAAISLYFRPGVTAYTARVIGPTAAAPESDVFWNLPQWELR